MKFGSVAQRQRPRRTEAKLPTAASLNNKGKYGIIFQQG